MHSSRIRTARLLTVSGSARGGGEGLPNPNPDADPPLWAEGITHACENITLPQTSFAGCKYLVDKLTFYHMFRKKLL